MTEEDKKSVVEEVLNRIKSDSQSVDELEIATTLDGVHSLPAIRGQDLVSAPISLLDKPARDAAEIANKAAQKAEEASSEAQEKADLASSAAQSANSAAEAAEESSQKADALVKSLESYDDTIDSIQTNLSTVNTRSAENKEKIGEHETTISDIKNKINGLDSSVDDISFGATVRFDGIVNSAIFKVGSYAGVGTVVYSKSDKKFGIKPSDTVGSLTPVLYTNWGTANKYMNAELTEPLKDKIYICGSQLYIWDDIIDNLRLYTGIEAVEPDTWGEDGSSLDLKEGMFYAVLEEE